MVSSIKPITVDYAYIYLYQPLHFKTVVIHLT